MEFRRLIGFGKSSFVISIPKSWVIHNKLSKGDTVYIDEKPDELRVFTNNFNNDSLKETEINIEGKDAEELKREMIAAYVNNNNVITIIGKGLKERANEVRNHIQNLIALEIMEQTATKVVAKDFLNMKEISVRNIVRRMDIITRAMIADSKMTFEDDRYESVYNRDEDVNRLAYLLLRAMRYAINNPSIAKTMDMTQTDLLNHWHITHAIEEIADDAKRAARFLRMVKLSDGEFKKLESVYSDIEKTYLDTMKAYYTKNRELASKMSSRKNELAKGCDAFLDKNHRIRWVPNITEKLKSMTMGIHKIAKTVAHY